MKLFGLRSAKALATMFALAALIAVSACASNASDGSQNGSSEAASTGATEGAPLPDIRIAPLEGGEASDLSSVQGPAVINLWATWCVPCRLEMPAFEAVHQDLGDKVRFLGLNVDAEAKGAAEFVSEVGVTYEQVMDVDARASADLGITSMPTTIVIDESGVVTDIHRGELDEEELRELLGR